MAKRIASSDINHDNWDAPFVPEDAGSFKIAAQDTLQKRVIKTAKRRIKTSESSDAGKSVFASFGGFKPVAASHSSDTGKTFSFLSSGPATTSSNMTMPTNGTKLAAPQPRFEMTNSNTLSLNRPQQKYLSDLKELNQSVVAWIKKHVESDSHCILSPVFEDYNKHLNKIRADRDAEEKASSVVSSAPASSLSSFNFVSSSTSDNKFTINIPTTSVDSDETKFVLNSKMSSSDSKTSPSIFGLKGESGKSPLLQGAETGTSKTPSIFSSFKDSSTTGSGSSLLTKPDPAALMVNPFTSTLTKPFSFSNGSTPTSSSNNQQQEKEQEKEEEVEESDEPPKVVFTPVQEEGSVFSTRCKVFVKKDNNYKDRGVGTLFIKKVGEEKYQLLVRAETVLGNVLVNVLLTNSIPTQRMGKNNVMLVCLPTPQDLPPPTTVLLRVKTDVEADDLLATIEQYKQ
uniref:RanBD1 domain-containing protein n=1 Tax=Cuerna arida TaxID=1464854 RepID=A0A1B6FFS8_9HEMI